MNIVCPNQACGRFQTAEFEGTNRFRCKACKTVFTVTTPQQPGYAGLDNSRKVVFTK